MLVHVVVAGLLSLAGQGASASEREVQFHAHGVSPEIGSPGHAWVCIAAESAVRRCFGFRPRSVSAELFALFSTSNRPGEIVEEREGDRASAVAFAVDVSKAQVDAIERLADSWTTRGYNLSWSNCADFVAEVAMAVGLDIPDGAGPRYPTALVRALYEANPAVVRRL